MSKELIKKYSIKAKKSLGQNFLVNEKILDDISGFLDIFGKNIIEVGPGYGALTEKLLIKKPKKLTLIELDISMIKILEDRINKGYLDINGVDFSIKNTDILKFKPTFSSYSVIANIPYYITSPILKHFLYDCKQPPQNMLILMQKDVADKILGNGKNKSSVLSLFINKKCFTQQVLLVPKKSFIPEPKVESSVLSFKTHNLYDKIDDKKFLEFIKKGFSKPRKKLSSNLINAGFLQQSIMKAFIYLDINEDIRGEDLTIKQWIELHNFFIQFEK